MLPDDVTMMNADVDKKKFPVGRADGRLPVGDRADQPVVPDSVPGLPTDRALPSRDLRQVRGAAVRFLGQLLREEGLRLGHDRRLRRRQLSGWNLLLLYLALTLCSPIDGVASISIFYYMEILVLQFLVSGSIFQPTTLCQEGEKIHLNLLPMEGIKPGPPAQQARALSITPLPLG